MIASDAKHFVAAANKFSDFMKSEEKVDDTMVRESTAAMPVLQPRVSNDLVYENHISTVHSDQIPTHACRTRLTE